MNDKLIDGMPRCCGDCANFDRYKDEDNGYGGCDVCGYTKHADEDASDCDEFL